MTATADTALDTLAVNTIRFLAVDAVQKANSGHPGAPMGLAPFGYVLYSEILRHDPGDPRWPGRDRFVLSGGHGCMLQYALLHLCGYDLTMEDLESFRQWGSRTPGHPEYGMTPGIEASTGPLGQGVANSVGFAVARAWMGERYNRSGEDIVDWCTYFQCGDGDLQEGIASEAASFAGTMGLGNLIGVYDSNHVQLAGPTDLAFREDVAARFQAYGWHVSTVEDGESLGDIRLALQEARGVTDRPSLIVLHTHIGYGSPHKQDTYQAHGEPLGEEEVRLTKEALGWPVEPAFLVPDEVRERFAAVRERGAALHAEWDQRYETWAADQGELAQEFERVFLSRRPPPAVLDAPLPERPEPGTSVATRASAGKALNWLAPLMPELVGGDADLTGSTKTHIDDGGEFLHHSFRARNLHFGVREHGMGGIVNGMTLCGLRAFGATFFTFSDYMRPSIRLAALMEIPSVFVFTHDSVGLGEDGPTHQPIEQLASLRAMPHLEVIRPADLTEACQAWRWALTRQSNPVALVLSRQGTPALDPSRVPDDAIERGAYVYRDPDSGEADVVLIGTGTEVALCDAAADVLAARGIGARVVSMPCWERFAAQPDDYRDSVLPPGGPARVAVELGSPAGWCRWVGEEGRTVTIDRFGASAPIADILRHLGFTADDVAAAAREAIGR